MGVHDIIILMKIGYCQCGCGKKTWVATYSSKTLNLVKGVPVKFATGHGKRVPRPLESAKPFKIDGVYCRLVPLTQGLHCIVDAADYKWLMQWNWSAERDHKRNEFYAGRRAYRDDGSDKISMHRLILGLTKGDTLKGDHWNGNTLDNRRKNLRVATNHQNQYNRKRPKNNTSGLTGIRYELDRRKWKVTVGVNGRPTTVGRCASKEAALQLRTATILRLRGEFARVEKLSVLT